MAEFEVGQPVKLSPEIKTGECSFWVQGSTIQKIRDYDLIGKVLKYDAKDKSYFVAIGWDNLWFLYREIVPVSQTKKGTQTMKTGNSWQFHSAAQGDINYAEIIDCLTRANPIAICTIANKITEMLPMTQREIRAKYKPAELRRKYTELLDTLDYYDEETLLFLRLFESHKVSFTKESYFIAVSTYLLHKSTECGMHMEAFSTELFSNQKGAIYKVLQKDFALAIHQAKEVKRANWPSHLKRNATVKITMPTI